MTEQTAIIPAPSTDITRAVLKDLAGQLAPRSQRLYISDGNHFANWLAVKGLALDTVGRSTMIEYRAHLGESYAKSTAGRMFIIARRLLSEAVSRGDIANNPAKDVRGFKNTANETPHRALTLAELRELLKTFNLSTAIGKRNYALVSLLVRTGLRRSEAVALTIGDLKNEGGYDVAIIQHGKGDKRRVVKLPPDVKAAIDVYLVASGLGTAVPAAPLFCQFDKGDRARPGSSVTDKTIERVVLGAAKAAGLDGLTPHGLRATFVTLTLEGGAKLHQVQYAAGHASPVTTERYQKRKLSLEDNAVDYLKP